MVGGIDLIYYLYSIKLFIKRSQLEYIDIINKIRTSHCYNSEDSLFIKNKKYCEFFASLLSEDDLFLINQKYFKHQMLDNDDISLVLNMMFNESDIKSMILFFYQVSDDNLFNKNFLKKISYCPDFVLSKDKFNNVMSFLFLYFNPFIGNYSNMWQHPIHDKPLMVFTNITDNNFNILLYLFNVDVFAMNHKFKTGFNLCHQLVEFYLDNISGSIVYRDKVNNLKDYNFPVNKIKRLIKEGFSMDSFLKIRDNKMYFTSESLSSLLEEIIVECNMEQLELVISKKIIEADNKIFKI